jgi:hypothetical protein
VRLPGTLGGMAETLRGTAVIIGSNMDPDHDPNDVEDSADDSLLAELVSGAMGTLYEFTLDVTVPGHESYQVGGVRSRVPSKAARISLFETHPIPLTLEVPVVVKVGDAEKVAIDWKAFLAFPDRVPRLKAARERALDIAGARLAAANPEMTSAQVVQNKQALEAWIPWVRSGGLSRKDFEQSCATLMRLGQMDRADYEAAVARIDAP